jgi:hypothetical protein
MAKMTLRFRAKLSPEAKQASASIVWKEASPRPQGLPTEIHTR